MSESEIKKCPKCGQKLRIPGHVGGILMVCPMCKQKIHSDFKVGTGKVVPVRPKKSVLLEIFELPGKMLDKLLNIFKS